MVEVQKKLLDGNEEIFCKRCHRKLRDEKYKKLGFGKICYEKYIKKSSLYLFDMGEK